MRDWFLPDGSVVPDDELLRERPLQQQELRWAPEGCVVIHQQKSPAELRRRYNQPWRDEDAPT